MCRCSLDIDECESVPCQHGGVCIDQVNGYECNCTTNYTGLSCEFDVCLQQFCKTLLKFYSCSDYTILISFEQLNNSL